MRSNTFNSKAGEREGDGTGAENSVGDYDQKIKEVIISTVSIKPTLYGSVEHGSVEHTG